MAEYCKVRDCPDDFVNLTVLNHTLIIVARVQLLHIQFCETRVQTPCGRSSVVERQLPKLNVDGSSPFARSFLLSFRVPVAKGPLSRSLVGLEIGPLPELQVAGLLLVSFCSQIDPLRLRANPDCPGLSISKVGRGCAQRRRDRKSRRLSHGQLPAAPTN